MVRDFNAIVTTRHNYLIWKKKIKQKQKQNKKQQQQKTKNNNNKTIKNQHKTYFRDLSIGQWIFMSEQYCCLEL